MLSESWKLAGPEHLDNGENLKVTYHTAGDVRDILVKYGLKHLP